MSDSKVYMLPDGNNNSLNPALMMALSQNGGFGNGMNWMWPMFLFFMFPWLFGGNGFGGFGGFGNVGSIAGTGFLTNQLNNDVGRELLIQAINGRTDSLSLLAQVLNTNVSSVQNGINAILSAVQSVGAQVGMSGQLVINSIQNGNASLSQQICECCCNARLENAQQTNALQAQVAANQNATQAQLAGNQNALQAQIAASQNALASQAASNFAADQLAVCEQTNTLQTQSLVNQNALQVQALQNQNALQNQISANQAADQLAVCQQTNTLQNQAERDTNSILGAIANQSTMITKEFCDLRERELLNKISTQGDIITQLRGQLDNDRQTAQLYSAISPIQAKVNEIANKQPNTVPVEWPNITAVNNTPYAGGFYGYGWNGSFWG